MYKSTNKNKEVNKETDTNKHNNTPTLNATINTIMRTYKHQNKPEKKMNKSGHDSRIRVRMIAVIINHKNNQNNNAKAASWRGGFAVSRFQVSRIPWEQGRLQRFQGSQNSKVLGSKVPGLQKF